MAIYNEILSARFGNALKKALSMKGATPTKQLSGELTPILGMQWGVGERWLEGWNRFALAIQQTAVGGNASGIRWRNPSGSGVIAVMEKISYPNLTASANSVIFQQGSVTTDLSTTIATTNTPLDGRQQSTGSTLILSKQASAASVPAIQTDNKFVIQQPIAGYADLILYDNQEIPILPGFGMQALLSTVNLELDVNIMWRERYLEESERQ